MLNCNGLNDRTKRNLYISELQKGQPDLLILVDSRLANCESTLREISRMDSYHFELCGESSIAKGITVLIKNSSNMKLIKVHSDPGGQYIFLETIHELRPVLFVGVYGPSDGDNLNFWQNLHQKIEDFQYENVLIMGDTNFYLSHALDTKNFAGNKNIKPKTAQFFNDLITEGYITDAFRALNPNKRSFTWSAWNKENRKRKEKSSRIDNVFCSLRFMSFIKLRTTKL